MQDTKLSYPVWAMAIFILDVGIKGTSSMKLHRDLDITQKAAWYLAHRIREAWNYDPGQYKGPAEIDEPYVGGKEKNKKKHKRLNAGHGTVGKMVVVGVKDRKTKQVQAQVVTNTTSETLTGFVYSTSELEAQYYTPMTQKPIRCSREFLPRPLSTPSRNTRMEKSTSKV